MAMDYNILSVSLSEAAGDDASLYVLKAPSAANGGGLTILEAYVIDEGATTSGTSWAVALHKYSSAGTPAVNGTIAAAIGGTSDPFAKGVPKTFTIAAAYRFLDAGEWLVIEKTEDNSSDPTHGYVTVSWIPGKIG